MDDLLPTDRLEAADAGWILLGLFVVLVFGFVFYSYIGTFVFAIFIYYATRPVHRRVKTRVRPPSLAAGVSLFVLALPLLLLLGFTLLIGIREATAIAQENQLNVIGFETRLYIQLQPYFSLLESPMQLLSSPDRLDVIRDILEQTSPFLGLIAGGLMHGFIMIGVAFYLLRDDKQLSTWVTSRFGDGGLLETYLDAVDTDYHQIFFGNILNALITGLIGAVTFNALNFFAPPGLAIPFPTLLGLLSGAASLIPLVGMKLVYVPATVYLLFVTAVDGRFDVLWFPLSFGLVAFFIVDVIPDLVLRPYVSTRDLHLGSVMFAYVLGPLLFGWYGIFLGPMLLVLAVRFNRIVLPQLLSRMFDIDPAASPPTGTSSLHTPPQESSSSQSIDPETPGSDPDVD